MVLNVHGGPWARDAWGFDPEAQWLANRGYLCVQVNFRGSTGYGKAFVNAGDREWGRADAGRPDRRGGLRDRQGWADPARVAIFGGSYGGYAALAGATFTPELFRCAVDIVGPVQPQDAIETIPPYWAADDRPVPHPGRRPGARTPSSSGPARRCRAPPSIRTPLLIAQGANDPRVKQAESEQIVAALREAGIDHEYMLFPDEGHGFAKPENRLKFYAAAERFLARHLGGRAEDDQRRDRASHGRCRDRCHAGGGPGRGHRAGRGAPRGGASGCPSPNWTRWRTRCCARPARGPRS